MWKEMVAYFHLKIELINSLIGDLIYVFKPIFYQTNILTTLLHKKQKYWQ